MAKLRALFKSGARLTHHDVAARLFVAPRNAREYINTMRSDLRIVDWRRTGSRGLQVPVYAAGPGDDEPRPEAIKAVEHQRRRRLRAEVRAEEAKQKRIQRLGEKFATHGLPIDRLTAALVTPLSVDHE